MGTQRSNSNNKTPAHPCALVIGLGNPILGDDGVGWKIAERLQEEIPHRASDTLTKLPITVEFLSLGGLSLMEHMLGYSHVLLLDSLTTHSLSPGAVSTIKLDDLPDHSSGHTTAPHDTSLRTAMKLAGEIGAHVPEAVILVAIEIEPNLDFSDQLSPPVEAAIPAALNAAFQVLAEWAGHIPYRPIVKKE